MCVCVCVCVCVPCVCVCVCVCERERERERETERERQRQTETESVSEDGGGGGGRGGEHFNVLSRCAIFRSSCLGQANYHARLIRHPTFKKTCISPSLFIRPNKANHPLSQWGYPLPPVTPFPHPKYYVTRMKVRMIRRLGQLREINHATSVDLAVGSATEPVHSPVVDFLFFFLFCFILFILMMMS